MSHSPSQSAVELSPAPSCPVREELGLRRPPSPVGASALPPGLGGQREAFPSPEGSGGAPRSPALSTCCRRRLGAPWRDPGVSISPRSLGRVAGQRRRAEPCNWRRSCRVSSRPFSGFPGGRDLEPGLPATPAQPWAPPFLPSPPPPRPGSGSARRRGAPEGAAKARAQSHGRLPLSDPEGPGAGPGEAPETQRDRVSPGGLPGAAVRGCACWRGRRDPGGGLMGGAPARTPAPEAGLRSRSSSRWRVGEEDLEFPGSGKQGNTRVLKNSERFRSLSCL